MIVTPTDLPGVMLLTPQVLRDDRGYFYESWNDSRFALATGKSVAFVQDNHSCSKKGTLRGLHFQLAPFAQGKLVRVVQGEAWDVAVDIRPGSATFGRWTGHRLSARNRQQLWIPEGFAHGFVALTHSVEVLYKVTAHYSKTHERAIAWDDPALAITWPIEKSSMTISKKDREAPPLGQHVPLTN
jgi:dTDP-4-dehydrorhamnose 3,5-epimerase